MEWGGDHAGARARLAEWNDLIQQNVRDARQVLDAALEDRISAAPEIEGANAPCWRLDVPIAWDRLLSRLVPDVMPGLQDRVASPTGDLFVHAEEFEESLVAEIRRAA